MAAGLVACGDAAADTDGTSVTVPHVGQLPDLQTGRGPDGRPASVGTLAPTGATDDTATDDTTSAGDGGTGEARGGPDGAIGAAADGNRILALGDSITAAIGPQYGGQLCDALEAQGWFLGVDAFQGRAIDAGLSVLRDAIDTDEWDAAIVNLGSNYRGDPDAYEAQLRQILDRLRSMPVVVVTVTEFEDDIAEVNAVIRDLAEGREQITVVEWAELTRDDDSLTGADGLHLSEDGRAALAEALADAVGEAPTPAETEPGCDVLRDAEADAPSGGDADGEGDAANGDGGDDGGG